MSERLFTHLRGGLEVGKLKLDLPCRVCEMKLFCEGGGEIKSKFISNHEHDVQRMTDMT